MLNTLDQDTSSFLSRLVVVQMKKDKRAKHPVGMQICCILQWWEHLITNLCDDDKGEGEMATKMGDRLRKQGDWEKDKCRCEEIEVSKHQVDWNGIVLECSAPCVLFCLRLEKHMAIINEGRHLGTFGWLIIAITCSYPSACIMLFSVYYTIKVALVIYT